MTTNPTTPIRLSGTNLVRAADHNQRVTLHTIRVNGSLTRVELAGITGLTAPAIANITKRLHADGLIEEAGRLRGGRGQPPTKLVINPNACYGIGINVDRDHVTIVLVNFLGETIARRSREIEFALPADVASFYRGSIDAMIADAGVDPALIIGIGIAIPDDLGTVDLPGRPDSYGEWSTIDLATLVASPLQLPVFVENDAAAAAMGEQQLGHGQRYSSFFYILISWALGGGLVIEGSYFRGAQGRSGEIGFLMSDDGSGRQSQIQTFVSLSGLSQILRSNGSSIEALLLPDDADEVSSAVTDAWIDQAVIRLAEPLAAVNCLINPAAVLVGGRLPGTLIDRLAERLDAHLRATATHVPTIAPVRRAMLAEDAPAVGAAILPFSYFLLPKPNALWKASQPADAPTG